MGNKQVKMDPKGIVVEWPSRGDEAEQENDWESLQEDRKGKSQGRTGSNQTT